MPSLPIPVFAACVLAFLALRAWRRGSTSRPFLVLIFACAVQALVVAGHHHYGLWLAQMAQPVVALCLPSLAWLAFVAGVRRPLGAQDLWHLVAPGAGLFARVAAHNSASLAVLTKVGFTEVSRDIEFAPGVGRDREEIVLVLVPTLE